MEIRILTKEQQEQIYPRAYELLAAADEEFVPPLSFRTSSTQHGFTADRQADGIRLYFEQLKEQRFAAVYDDGELIAFVSYRENYTCPEISAQELPNIYLSTLIVSPEARGKGVTKALYAELFSRYSHVNIFTRTWSTNAAHIKILQKYGFDVIKVLEHDRGPGVHTVYFKKSHI